MLKKKFALFLIFTYLFSVMGISSISASAQTAMASVEGSKVVERLAGVNRFETSIAISKSKWSQSETVIIASGLNYPDALAAAALTKIKDAPILLSSKDSLDNNTLAEIRRLKAKKAILVGGVGVIGTGVESQLLGLGIGITRFGGVDRYDTSKKVAEEIGVKNGIALVAGFDFQSALSMAPICSIKTMPILLTPKNALDLNVQAFIKDKSIPVSYLAGDVGVLDSSIDTKVPGSKRLGGADKYTTNISINNEFSSVLSFDTIYIASGNDYPDALSGSALAAKNNSPIILTDTNSIPNEVINFIKSKRVKHVVLLGGTGAISENVENIIKTTIESMIIHVASISLNKTALSLYIGTSETLVPTLSPITSDDKSVIWSSSNSSVASVDQSGKINALTVGSTTISAITVDGAKKAECSVTVINSVVKVQSITLNKTSDILAVGGSERLIGNIYPANASNKYISWKSSNTDVVTVDNAGNIKAITTGSAIITATAYDGKLTANCDITVVEDTGTTPPPPKAPLVFAIDIGHNAKYNAGAVGIRGEDACTKEVGILVMKKLTDLGYTVVNVAPTNPTSQTDSLKQRVDIANKAHADYFISIHFNKFDGIANGTEIYMGSNKIKDRAQRVLDNFVALGYSNRGLRDNSRGLYVLKNTNMPAMLIECSFVDSVYDMTLYDPEAISDAIVNGIIDSI